MLWSARWREMSLFRRVLLALLAAMALGFGIATPLVAGVQGVEYGEAFLRLEEEGDLRRYSGQIDWERAEFTVSPGGRIEYRWGEYTYGPYQVEEDPTALPADRAFMTGIRIDRGEETLFRGGFMSDSMLSLYGEDGEPVWEVEVYATASDGTVMADGGRVVSQEELHTPSLSVLARLVLAPELTHRGSFGLYLLVTLLAGVNMAQICFPGFMFRLSLWGRVRNVDAAEPSDFYIAMEHLEWVVLTIAVFAFYWMSLSVIT